MIISRRIGKTSIITLISCYQLTRNLRDDGKMYFESLRGALLPLLWESINNQINNTLRPLHLIRAKKYILVMFGKEQFVCIDQEVTTAQLLCFLMLARKLQTKHLFMAMVQKHLGERATNYFRKHEIIILSI